MISEQLKEIGGDIFQPDVYLASSLERDSYNRRQVIRLLGATATCGLVNSPEQQSAEEASLPSVVADYFSDDLERATRARSRLAADLRTNTFEILCASGHVSVYESVYAEDGFYQNGYNMLAMYANATNKAQYIIEQRRRAAETLNELRIKEGFESGRTQTHYFIEISRSPDDMPVALADKIYGYDSSSWKTLFRCTEVDDSGNRATETTAVRGVDRAGRRHDAKAVQYIRQAHRTSIEDKTATSDLAEAYWIEKESLPDRVVGLVKLFDAGCGDQGDAFFGNVGQSGDYESVVELSQRREKQVQAQLSQQLHSLALELAGAPDRLSLEIMASHAKDFAAELCCDDNSYDPRQFGSAAAAHIERSRYYRQLGLDQEAQHQLQQAKHTAVVYMCGMRFESETAETPKRLSEELTTKDCDYISKECPLCKAKNVRTHETATKITCSKCKQSVHKSKNTSSLAYAA